MTHSSRSGRRVRQTLLGVGILAVLSVAATPFVGAQATADTPQRVHALIRVPTAVPAEDQAIEDPGSMLVHITEGPLDAEKAFATRNDWLHTGVPYRLAFYPAVAVWTSLDERQ